MTDEEISNRLSSCALAENRGTFAAGTFFGDWRITAFIAKGGTAGVRDEVKWKLPATVQFSITPSIRWTAMPLAGSS